VEYIGEISKPSKKQAVLPDSHVRGELIKV